MSGVQVEKSQGERASVERPEIRDLASLLADRFLFSRLQCDKVRPLCGPCRKHGLTEGCTWAIEVADPSNGGQDAGWAATELTAAANDANAASSSSHPNGGWASPAAAALANQFAASAAVQAAAASASASASASGSSAAARGDRGPQEDGSSSTTTDQHHGHFATAFADPNGAASHLESLLSDRGQFAAWGQQFAAASEHERGTAADALALIAQQQASSSSHHTSAQRGGRFPFSIRAETARDAMSLLPSDADVDWLLDEVLDAQFAAAATFYASHRLVRLQLAKLRETEQAQVDVSFLALLFYLLVLAAEVAHPNDLASRGIVEREDSVPGLVEAWHAAGEACLSAADAAGSANLNCIMALTAARHFYTCQGRLTQAATTLCVAIRLAQAMGLHRLGSAAQDQARWTRASRKGARASRAEDVVRAAFGHSSLHLAGEARDSFHGIAGLPRRSHLIREASRRLWYHLVAQDWLTSSERGIPSQIPEGSWSTALPLKVDEESLAEGDGGALPTEKELDSEPTDAAGLLYLWWIAEASEARSERDGLQPERPGSSSPPPSPDVRIGTRLHSLLDELPIYLRLDGESEHNPVVREQESARPYLAALRFVVLTTIHHRLLRLHRRCLAARGTQGEVEGEEGEQSQQTRSTRASVDAARMIIFIRQSITQRDHQPTGSSGTASSSSAGAAGGGFEKFWLYRHLIFDAALALAVHLLRLTTATKQDGHVEGSLNNSEEERARLRDEISVAVSMLAYDPHALGGHGGAASSSSSNGNAGSGAAQGDPFARARQIVARVLASGAKEEGHDRAGGEELEALYAEVGDVDAAAAQEEQEDGATDLSLAASLGRLIAEAQGKGTVEDEARDKDLLWTVLSLHARPGFV